MALFDPRNEDHLIGQKYKHDNSGNIYVLHGILYGEDDWYWEMINIDDSKDIQWLSCVGNIEVFGFERIDG